MPIDSFSESIGLYGFRRVRAAVPWSLDSSVGQITKPRYQVKQQSAIAQDWRTPAANPKLKPEEV
jgi:hypothetical protein